MGEAKRRRHWTAEIDPAGVAAALVFACLHREDKAMSIKREDVEKLLEVHHYDPQAWHALVGAVLEMGDALEDMRQRLEALSARPTTAEEELRARDEMPVSEAEQAEREAEGRDAALPQNQSGGHTV
jgi:hypothetical protein